MYKLPVYDASGRLPLSEDTLLGCLRYLVEDSNSRGAGPALGVLTTDDRDRWNEARELLVDGGNEESLRTVETAILTLSLDPPASTGSADGADVDSLNTIHAITGAGLGDCTANRWFDKAVQVSWNEKQTCVVLFVSRMAIDSHLTLAVYTQENNIYIFLHSIQLVYYSCTR